MTRYADADKLLSLFSFDGDPELSHLNENGPVPIPLIKDSIETYIVNNVVPITHGYWVNPHWKNSNYCCNCSECGGEAMHREYQWDKNGIYPICPNCGAKMDKEDAWKDDALGQKED